jgi:hypothetical protein
MTRQRYLIEWFRGKISDSTREGHTHVRAMDTVHARKFGQMRRPGLIVLVTPAKEII